MSYFAFYVSILRAALYKFTIAFRSVKSEFWSSHNLMNSQSFVFIIHPTISPYWSSQCRGRLNSATGSKDNSAILFYFGMEFCQQKSYENYVRTMQTLYTTDVTSLSPSWSSIMSSEACRFNLSSSQETFIIRRSPKPRFLAGLMDIPSEKKEEDRQWWDHLPNRSIVWAVPLTAPNRLIFSTDHKGCIYPWPFAHQLRNL